MNDFSNVIDGLVNMWDTLINPSMVSLARPEDSIAGLVSIGVLIFFIGLSSRAAGQLGKPVAVTLGVALAIALLGMKGGVSFVVRITAVFGCILRLFGGVALARSFFDRPVTGVVFVIALIASLAIGYIWLPTIGADQLVAFKLALMSFAPGSEPIGSS